MSPPRLPGLPRLFVFGWGGVGAALGRRLKAEGWAVSATARSEGAAAALAAEGVQDVDVADPGALAAAAGAADAVLVTAPPDDGGCPGLAALAPALRAGEARPWIGYLSTTGVYGDHGGRWVFEQTPTAPQSAEAHRRVAAETAWSALAAETGATLAIFRLPGLYGPGRSALDRVRAGDARRLVRPGQVFSRLHLGDAATAIATAIARPRAGAVFNLCDDLPAPSADVTAHAARLLGLPVPPEEPVDLSTLSVPARRFWSENKRVSNALAKAELGWRPAFPTYREGLAAILAAQGR
ncbi:NAD-dependent epimerase/dehydratase family protein [Caulobacter sp. KR2-114]|uniref:NAD-dependent epimerase/dehydratase family protein n=1 Tax=Caulobacter sp. KR2-114 TaxID=3400912 RepID=UPI003C00C197